MANGKRKKSDFQGLLEKYKNISVVSEIERNLSQAEVTSYPSKNLYLSDFYDEKNYDLYSFPQLEESLKKDGFLIPLIIVKGEKENTYEILNGAKRYLFARQMKMEYIPCVLATISPERKMAYLVENIIQEGGCALTKTTCFVKMKEKYGFSESQIASLSHMSLSQVRNLIRLNSLPDYLKEALRTYQIRYGEARSLLNMDQENQRLLYDEIRKRKLSVRDIESKKREFIGKKQDISISRTKKKIVLSFSSEEEAIKQLERLKKEYHI